MAITKCKECGRDVSSAAKKCLHCGVGEPGVTLATTLWSWAFALAVLVGGWWFLFGFRDDDDEPVRAPRPQLSLADEFPGPWRLDAPGSISVALGRKQIRDCGEYRYRQSVVDPYDYLVYCSRDGKSWLHYRVRPARELVLGPYAVDPSVPL